MRYSNTKGRSRIFDEAVGRINIRQRLHEKVSGNPFWADVAYKLADPLDPYMIRITMIVVIKGGLDGL